MRAPAPARAWSLSLGTRTYTYLPKENALRVAIGAQEASRRSLVQLLKNYKAEYAGNATVAGRAACIINLTGRHKGMPAKKLWIDKERSVILRTIDYSANGDERNYTDITRIDFHARISADKFLLPGTGSVKPIPVCEPADPSSLEKILGFPVTPPRYMPEGYELDSYHLFYSQCACGRHSAQITYTDGLNVISVFERPLMGSCCAACRMSAGRCEGCAVGGCEMGRAGSLRRGNKTVVVVGDLLPSEIKKIAESVD